MSINKHGYHKSSYKIFLKNKSAQKKVCFTLNFDYVSYRLLGNFSTSSDKVCNEQNWCNTFSRRQHSNNTHFTVNKIIYNEKLNSIYYTSKLLY